MNFLAHLHIAQHCKSSLAGNLLGDFVKGDPSKHYNPELCAGIKLHRFVDSFTDTHEITLQCKRLFSNETRRYSPIALDVFWDHCLAQNWSKYHPQPLFNFCQNSHRTIQHEVEPHWSENFVFVHEKMSQGRWLESYQSMESIEVVLQRMALRRPRLAALAHCFKDLEDHYDSLQCHFESFYPTVLKNAYQFNQLEIQKNNHES